MARSWRTIRVFISSTFRDMHAERDWLVGMVFPALRERLLPYRFHLDDVDLRWGVTREQADRDQALDLCLEQIDQTRPFFIGILGQRYGYVPNRFSDELPSKYGWVQAQTGKSITELEILHGVLREPQMRERSLFLFRDPAFLADVPEPLRPQFEGELDPSLPDEQAQREAREADQAKLANLKQEIRSAGLPIPPIEGYPCRFAGMRIDWRYARLGLAEEDFALLDQAARDGLITPAEFARLDDRGRQLTAQWAVPHLTGLDEFGRAVKDQLWRAIQAEHDLPETPPTAAEGISRDELAEELDFHLRFQETRLRVYVGRKAIGRQLEAYADADGDDTAPCLVTGRSGSGKSAALANFAVSYGAAHPDVLVVPHFVGASPGSTSLRQLLRRFCLSMVREFGLADTIQRDGAEPESVPAEVPLSINELIPRFRDFIGRVPEQRRLVFVIDALDQLDDADNALDMHWLPRRWPPHVKVVLSCLTDPHRSERVLSAFEHRPHHRLPLAALDDAEQHEIVRQVPSLAAKTLDELQVAMLLDNPAAGNPLFLLVALAELRGFGSFEQLELRIASFPRSREAPRPRRDRWPDVLDPLMTIAANRDRWAAWAEAVEKAPRVDDPVTAVFDQVIDRLEDDFGAQGTEDVLTLMAAARRGLSETELSQLVAGEGSTATAAGNMLFPILRQCRPYLQHRGPLLNFFHRNFEYAVDERFFPDHGRRAAAHARLAEFFAGQDYFLESLDEQRARAHRLPPTPRPANVRKVDELPWQLLQVGKLAGGEDATSPHWEAVANLLTDLQFLEAKAEAQP